MLKILILFALLMCSIIPTKTDIEFRNGQLRYSRVRNAYELKKESTKVLMAEHGIDYKSFEIFLRGLKKQRQLQLFARSKVADRFKLINTYDFCVLSGELGPKRRQGDYQVPEGCYHIDRYNPMSDFHLSLGIDYPNRSDRILGKKGSLGGDIFIHGNCVSIGCIPITDDKIRELYLIAVEARSHGQTRIPIHLFPGKMDDASWVVLKEGVDDQMLRFWRNLRPIYMSFEKNGVVPAVRVDLDGTYALNE